jgi:PERQ amino acid-rich with GYF domain-containing protein
MQPSASFSTAPLSATTSRASDSSAQKAVNPALKPRPTPSKQEDIIYSPSHEFLKWLSDSLKGLNSSVNGMVFFSPSIHASDYHLFS